MTWTAVTATDVRITPAEQAVLNAIQDSETVCATVAANVVAEFRDAIAATGATPGDAGTVPDLVRVHVINRIRWLWLCEFPQLKSFQTAEREKLNRDAVDMLAKILEGKALIVGPTDTSTSSGDWGSEIKFEV